MQHNKYDGLTTWITTAGFLGRIFGYLVLYIPITLVIDFFLIISANNSNEPIVDNVFLAVLILGTLFFGLTAIPFVLWELIIRRFRKKRGLSVWKNIEEDLKQIAVDEMVAREQKALEKFKKGEKSHV